jgi:AraC-like DNA-binding protein
MLARARRARENHAAMRGAATVDEMSADPVGRFTLGATHLVWCHSPSLCGSVHWGRPTSDDAAALVQRFGFTMHAALAGGFVSLMDARAMEAFDWPAFSVVAEHARATLPAWNQRIRRLAIVVPAGAVGATVAGLLPLVGATLPLRFFSALEPACEWLGDATLPPVLDEVARLVDEARGVPPLLRSLRDHLDGALADASIDTAARALGLSTRTLQRELRRHRTLFTLELMHARVRAARALLEHTDEKVEAIARRVGCSSSSRLSTLFTRYVGEQPARYRARHRR